MFKINQTTQKAVDTLYTNMKEAPYGKTFTWEELKTMTGNPTISQNILYYVANKVCLMLMQSDQKYLETVMGKGKRIINPEEHGLVAKKKVARSVRIYKKAGRVLASTNMDKLTEEQKKKIVQDANKYATLEMFAKETLKKKKIGLSKESDLRSATLFLDTLKLFTKQ